MYLFKNWTFHNIVAHPLMSILSLIGLSKAGEWIHDVTTPDRD